MRSHVWMALGLMTAVAGLGAMFRTMTNVTGHLTGAAIVATAQGERLG